MANEISGSEYDGGEPERSGLIENMRLRPSMYLGSIGLPGLATFICSAVGILTSNGATFVTVSIDGDKYQFQSDAALQFELDSDGLIKEFESHWRMMGRTNGNALCAFSSQLEIRSRTADSQAVFRMESGARKQFEVVTPDSDNTGTLIRFQPDSEIFPSISISPYVLKHFLLRAKYRHPKVRFTISHGRKVIDYRQTVREVEVYHSLNGMADLFEATTANHIVLHEPIHIHGKRGELILELIFAFHGRKKDKTVLLIGDTDGHKKGTPLDGLKSALKSIREEFKVNEDVGVIALLMIDPLENSQFSGQNKEKIVNPELPDLVREIVIKETQKWLDEHPETKQHLANLAPVSNVIL